MNHELLTTEPQTIVPSADVVETAAETVADVLNNLDPTERIEAIEVANEELALAGLALVRLKTFDENKGGARTNRSRDQVIHEAIVTHKIPSLSRYANQRAREARSRLAK